MINEFQIRVLPEIASDDKSIIRYLSKEKNIDVNSVNAIRVLKRSIDARQRTIFINLTVRLFINEMPEKDTFKTIDYHDVNNKPQVIVVGAGPAGLFAALRLIELGLKPIVIERGKNVRDRKLDLALITKTHNIDTESNYSFGEGGAGAYSDGKLYTRSKKRGSVERILNIFCQHGASTDILIDAHPHIGTDKLPRVIENMRRTILDNGGEVYFQTKMTHLLIKGNNVIGCIANDKEFIGPVILATGHSARDVYKYLHDAGVPIEPKGIAVGVRLEHPSHLIDQIQYHSKSGRGKYLPAAEYSFVTQIEDRGVYSFCMCPGGFVVPAATGPQQIVVNGMSPSSRNGQWSNSGMVVETRPDDIEGDDALKMMYYQEDLERNCWQQGNMKQNAPAQRMADFVNNRLSFDLPRSSYAPGLISSPLHFWLPKQVSTRLQNGFKQFGKMSHGFLTNEAILIAVETRTSAPVRICRDKITLQSTGIDGLYPCGEGAGFAGGIVSAAIDGEKCAESVASKYCLK